MPCACVQEAAGTVVHVSSTLSQPAQPEALLSQLPQSAAQALHQCMDAACAPAVCGSGSRAFLASVIGASCCTLAAAQYWPAVHMCSTDSMLLQAMWRPCCACPQCCAPWQICRLCWQQQLQHADRARRQDQRRCTGRA